MGITAFRRWPEVDRLLALALQEYEDSTCSGCGQPVREGMDPDLMDEWTTMSHNDRCGSCTALSAAADRNKDRDHPHALRYLVGLREGWQERRAQAQRDRAARQNP